MTVTSPVAAVPTYLEPALKEYKKEIAPGHKFLLYFEFWDKTSFAKKKESGNLLNDVCKLPDSTVNHIDALRARQKEYASLYASNALSIHAVSTAPFSTGLGNEHPTENGFAFLHPYGLPYLAGSGVKGALRCAMEQLGDEGDVRFSPEVIKELLGSDSSLESKLERGALSFWDVYPQPNNKKMVLEIMTPHYAEYYKGDASPHDSGTPTPITFLAIPAQSKFSFHVICQTHQLSSDLQKNWRDLLEIAFSHAFKWIGFGAKTSVGYGAMKEDSDEKRKREASIESDRLKAEQESQNKIRQEALQAMDPRERELEEFFDARPDKNHLKLTVFLKSLKENKWSGEMAVFVAQRVKEMMIEVNKWKETTQRKKPERDHEYQDTLIVLKFLK